MDAVPRKRSERYLWYSNLSTNLTAEGPKMGVSPADTTAAKAIVDAILGAMSTTDAASAALDGATSIERAVETSSLAQLRARIRNWKTLPNYAASGSEGVLKLKGAAAPDLDPANYKPVISLSIEAGTVKVDFEKKGVDGVAVYMRLRGQAQFRRIGTDTEAPFYDTTPLAQAGVPEVREYMARGMVGDDEVGLDSDIASIPFAG